MILIKNDMSNDINQLIKLIEQQNRYYYYVYNARYCIFDT